MPEKNIFCLRSLGSTGIELLVKKERMNTYLEWHNDGLKRIFYPVVNGLSNEVKLLMEKSSLRHKQDWSRASITGRDRNIAYPVQML